VNISVFIFSSYAFLCYSLLKSTRIEDFHQLLRVFWFAFAFDACGHYISKLRKLVLPLQEAGAGPREEERRFKPRLDPTVSPGQHLLTTG
jgi:hypothetical protein